ncbi:hypothetical protein GX586_00640, partial [bacterium]|nr:hypothetical protein [bacterium]
GTLVLVPGNTYTNRTTVNLGTLSISADSCLGTPPPEPLVNSLIMGGDSPGELAYNAILKATETFTLHANRGVQLLNAANAFEVVDGRTLTIAGDIGSNPNGGLNKAGNGLLKLTGACSWTGATAIVAGTLEFAPTVDCALEGGVTGSGELKLTGTGKVTFAGANDYSGNTTVSSGTIGGSGSPNSTMTIANGAGVAPGASIGVFQASNLAVAEGSAYDWEVDHTGPAADLVDVVNTLTLPSAANSVTVTLQNFSGGSGTFTAALYEFGSLAGDVASLKLDVASSGYAPAAPYVSGNSILVDLQPVPEPMVLGAVALAAAVLIRRRS